MGRKKKIIDGVIRILLKYKRRAGEGALYALIDVDDWPLAAIPWRALRTTTGGFYAYVMVPLGRGLHRSIYLHREVARAPNDCEIDHKNGHTLDCRRSNLRRASHVQNSRNNRLGRSNNTSGYKGVCRHKSGRWRSYIVVNNQQLWLGLYETKEEAAGAYDSAALGLFGRFARLNGPPR